MSKAGFNSTPLGRLGAVSVHQDGRGRRFYDAEAVLDALQVAPELREQIGFDEAVEGRVQIFGGKTCVSLPVLGGLIAVFGENLDHVGNHDAFRLLLAFLIQEVHALLDPPSERDRSRAH